MRYQAPEHTSGVHAPSRAYYADDKGIIEVPDDAPEADHAAMLRVGCVRAPDPAPAPAKAAAAPKPDAGE